MERTLERTYDQDRVRIWLWKYHGIDDEAIVKYVYDGYTFKGNYRAIRKPKTRKKVALAFHATGFSKKVAQYLVSEVIKRDGRI